VDPPRWLKGVCMAFVSEKALLSVVTRPWAWADVRNIYSQWAFDFGHVRPLHIGLSPCITTTHRSICVSCTENKGSMHGIFREQTDRTPFLFLPLY
jgi:hypothetical protein